MANRSAKSGKRTPEPYLRRRIAPYMSFYSTPGGRGRKILLICFKGRAHRLLLPIPVFLQHLPAAEYDVLMLSDPHRLAYIQGLPGIPEGFPGLIRAIDALVDRRPYRSVVSFGTSAGGLPALVLAARLGLGKGVSVSGGGRQAETPLSAELVPLLADSRGESAPPNLLAIYGFDSDRDRRSAESLTAIAGLRTLGVTSKTRQIGHNPLDPALVEGKLGSFLASALDPRVKGFADAGGLHTGSYEF
jgi:hypothetical protein